MNQRFNVVYFLLYALLYALGGCAAPSAGGPRAAPALPHPLEGRLWDPGTGQFLTGLVPLLADLPPSAVILVGERHDNPSHRVHQLEVLRALVGLNRAPAVGLESLNPNDEEAVNDFLQTPTEHVEVLGSRLHWQKRGWAPWSEFSPLFTEAKQHGLTVVGANLPRSQIREVVRRGFEALPPDLLSSLQLKERAFLTESARRSLTADIEEAHCGMLPAAMAEAMTPAQQTRDAVMAWHLGAPPKTVLAFVGQEHARQDRGIPLYLRHYRPDRPVITLHLTEVDPQKTSPKSYGRPALTYPGTYLWFTSPQKRSDPCESFKTTSQKASP